MKPAFTLIDFLVSVAVFAGVLGLATINLLSSQHKSNLSGVLATLITDLRAQQFKAMSGDTEGRDNTDSYGVYFAATSYTLFSGTFYNPSDPANFTVPLPSGLLFTAVTLPGSSIIFAKGSGEVIGWTSGFNSWQLTAEQAGRSSAVSVNKYGVIDDIAT